MKPSLIVFCSLIIYGSFAQSVIPMQVGKNGHLLVSGEISGVQGQFIFDTAAGLHVVSGKFFQKIKRHVRDSSYTTAFRHTGERLDGPVYFFDSVTLGSIKQNAAWVGVYEGFDEQGFDGLISAKLIEHQPVTVDVKKMQIIAESSESLEGRSGAVLPLLLHADRNRSLDVFIKVKIDNRYDAILEFDTGAGYSPLLLHTRYIGYAALDTTVMEIRQSGTGFCDVEKTFFDKTKRLHLSVPETGDGGYPNIIFKPSLIYDGLTSHIIFGEKTWTIDIPNQRMIVQESR